MTRRDFLKTTSLVTLSAILGHGCSSNTHNSPPSQWSRIDENFTLTNYNAISSVKIPAKIVADSDLLPSMVNYSPLRALGSDDAGQIKLDAVMESFNPHIMTSDTDDYFELNSINQPNRNYGVPEYVHLSRDNASLDYYLSIYEKSNDGHHGLDEIKIDLEGTANLSFNRLVSTNGSFHNKVKGSTVNSQKMMLMANVNEHEYSYTTSSKIPLQLFYQVESCELL